MTKNIVCHVLVQNDEFWLPYALECVRGVFPKYVIYDVGSTDGTSNIIDWFKQTSHGITIVKKLPDCLPKVQGVFRNAMIAEGGLDYYWILDGDELYKAGELISIEPNPDKMYGVIKRKEFSLNLTEAYDIDRTHHRLYSRLATWNGPHPGESPRWNQNASREFHIPDVTCYHMHNAERSTAKAHGRADRKSQLTYHPGNLVPFDLLKELPILRKPIENFPVAPALEKLQHEYQV